MISSNLSSMSTSKRNIQLHGGAPETIEVLSPQLKRDELLKYFYDQRFADIRKTEQANLVLGHKIILILAYRLKTRCGGKKRGVQDARAIWPILRHLVPRPL